MAVKAQYFVIIVVDIEKFGSRPNPVQSWLRQRLYELMEQSLDAVGIDHRAGPAPTDRGDGMFWLLPGSVPKTDLVGPFVTRLQTGLRAHAQTSNAAAALRLRVVLHAGEVAWDGRGWVGEDLNTACRMVDHQPLRQSLAAAEGAGLVVAISDAWHRAVLRHDYPELDSAGFRPVRFDAKEIENETVWIRVPGFAAPPGAPPHAGPAPGLVSAPATAPAPVPTTAPAPVPASAPAPAAPPRVVTADVRATVPRRPDMPHDDSAAERDATPGYITFNNASGATVGSQIGRNDGPISVTMNGGSGAAATAGNAELVRQIAELRTALREALDRRQLDAETYAEAAQELNEAARHTEAADPADRGRLVRALRRFRGLVEPITALAAAAATLISAVKGES